MVRAVIKYWFAIVVALGFTAILPQEARAEVRVGRPFNRNLGRLSSGRGRGFGFQVQDGRFQGINGAANLVDNDNNANNNVAIDGNGNLRVSEIVNKSGLVQRLQLLNDGRVIGLGNFREVSKDTARQVFNLLAPLANQDRRVALLSARASGNPGAFTGVFTMELDSIMEILGGDKGIQQCKANLAILKECALNALIDTINQASNLRTPITINKRAIRTLANGKTAVTINLGRIFNARQLGIFAGADQNFGCLGFMRGATVLSNFLNPRVWPDVKGIRGLTRNQIFDQFGCNKNKTDSIRNKVLVMGADGKSESGVTSANSRVVKWELQRANPGAMCMESDDFEFSQRAGAEAASADIRQTGIFYQQAASEALFEQSNGYMLGLLFNAAGAQQDFTPSTVTKVKVESNVDCMGCHTKGYASCGRKIVGGNKNEFYHNNLGSITAAPTVFRDRFGRRLNNRDFFTDNASCRKVMNFASSRFFRARARAGTARQGLLDADGYPLPFAQNAYASYGDRTWDPAAIGRMLGISEAAVKGAGINAPVSSQVLDQQACNIVGRAGGNRGGFAAQGGGTGIRTPAAGQSGVGGQVAADQRQHQNQATN